MNSTKTVVTVTTVPGRPSFTLEGNPETPTIAHIVAQRYGYHVADPQLPALPHSFCGTVDPAPAPAQAPNTQREVGAFGHWGAALSRSQRRKQSGC